jgi:hypothetical protein
MLAAESSCSRLRERYLYTAKNIAALKVELSYYIITLRIQALSLVENISLSHKTLSNSIPLFV